MREQEKPTPEEGTGEAVRQPYRKPRLRPLGTLRGLTKTLGVGGYPDIYEVVNDSTP